MKTTFSTLALQIFDESIKYYHKKDQLEPPMINPYKEDSIEYFLYHKNWIDTVQWHYEDVIRDPNIDPKEALTLKRKIDQSNQRRTDMVEHIDDFFLEKYKRINLNKEASINTESPAWAIDRLSILVLKIYHMREETERKEASIQHTKTCHHKLEILLEQKNDLSSAIDTLLEDIEQGKKYMKVYKQMKMYNEEELNPVLYNKKKS